MQRVYVSIQQQVILYHKGKSGHKLKAGAWTQEMKLRSWSNTIYWFAQFPFIYTPTSPVQGQCCDNGLGPPVSIINQENAPTELTIPNPLGTFSQLRFLLCVILTKTKQTNKQKTPNLIYSPNCWGQNVLTEHGKPTKPVGE